MDAQSHQVAKDVNLTNIWFYLKFKLNQIKTDLYFLQSPGFVSLTPYIQWHIRQLRLLKKFLYCVILIVIRVEKGP